MNWGIELWDQYDNVAQHTQKGIDFCEKYSHFLKERCSIEQEYASKLKKLAKNYQARKREEEEYPYSWSKGFWDMLKELHDLAGQHEVVAENIQGVVLKDIQNLMSEMKQDRKKHLQEGAKVHEQLKQSLACLDKSRRTYEKAFKEAEKATELYRKADADINLSRAEVEKHRNNMLLKNNQSDECKNEYALQLQQTNQYQKEHYTQQMPQVFQALQTLDENRINKMKEHVKQCADIERNVIPIINTCIDGMLKASDSMNSTEDSKLVVERYKSGFPIPEDIPFDDMAPDNNSSTNGTPKPAQNATDSRMVKGTGRNKKREKKKIFGLFASSRTTVNRGDDAKEDFSDLPPNQRKKQLQKKIDEIKKQVARETAEREGMLKMKDVYVQNPALGDPNSLDKKIEENAQKLDALQSELRKFQGYYNDAEGKQPRRGSVSDDATSQSSYNMESSTVSIPGTPQQQHTEPEVYTEEWPPPPPSPDNEEKEKKKEEVQEPEPKPIPPPLPKQDAKPSCAIDDDIEVDDHNQMKDQDDEFFDEDDNYPVIGTSRALYSFEAGNEGSVAMTEGEEMYVIEQDQGDGWTRVRKSDNSEGFVPTSYIQCHFYDQDEV